MKTRFDVMTVSGLVLGVIFISKAIMDGGNGLIFINLPSIYITAGGSFAAVLVHYSGTQLKNVFKVTKNALFAQVWDRYQLLDRLVFLAIKARRNGFLALEPDIEAWDDPFFQKGMRLVIDGVDSEEIRTILETEIECMTERHRLGQKFFLTWGSYAPAFGMVGTLIGLVQMLAQLEDPSTIGTAMAVALLTTLYGSLMAYLVLNPLAGKLSLRSEEEAAYKQVIVEGILAIQAGTNPVIFEEKMLAFMTTEMVRKREHQKKEVAAGES